MKKAPSPRTNPPESDDMASEYRFDYRKARPNRFAHAHIDFQVQNEEQLGSSDRFWRLITERRKEKTMSRAPLEQKLAAARPA